MAKQSTSTGPLEITMRIGKQGITPSLVEELRLQLKAKKRVKVKFLSTALENKDKQVEFARLAHLCHAKIEHSVGFVLILRV